MANRIFPLSAVLLFLISASLSFAQESSATDFQKGMSAYNTANYKKALDYFTYTIEDDPNSWEAFQMEGYCLFHLDRRDEMQSAFEQSLQIHPDNPELKAFIEKLSIPINTAPTPNTGTTFGSSATPHYQPTLMPAPSSYDISAVPSPLAVASSAAQADAPKKWFDGTSLKIRGRLDLAFLGDLMNGASSWNQEVAQTVGSGNASESQLGFGLAAEGIFQLSPLYALGLHAGYDGGHGYQENFSYGGQSETETLNPQYFTTGLDYYLYLPEHTGRFFLMGGLLFGLALVDVNLNDPSVSISGPFTGTTVGFELGLGREWMISQTAGFEVSVRFQSLSFPDVQNNYQDNAGNTGRMAVMKNPQGNLILADVRNLGISGLQYAVFDFTGFTVDFSYNLHFF